VQQTGIGEEFALPAGGFVLVLSGVDRLRLGSTIRAGSPDRISTPGTFDCQLTPANESILKQDISMPLSPSTKGN
jgi:hypothetical protein